MINKLVKLANHLDKKGLQKEADYLDSILKKLASKSDEETSIRLSEAEEEFYDPNFPDIEVKVVYNDWEDAWDQTRWVFILNGKEVKFISNPSEGAVGIADMLTDFIGVEAGVARKGRYEVDWNDVADYGDRSEYKEYIFNKTLSYLENIERLPSDLKEAQAELDRYQQDPYR